MSDRPVPETLRTYGRGVGGGLLFSLPLLYTMEVWWTGQTASPLRLLAFLGGTAVLLTATSWAAGLRPDADLREDLFETGEELGLGIVTAAVVLVLVGQLPASGSAGEWIGKLAVAGAVAAIGVSIGTAELGDADGEAPGERGRGRRLVGDVGFAALGALLVSANVAPTEEVVMIAAQATRWELAGLAAVSLAVTALLLRFSDFRGASRLAQRPVPLGPLRETTVTYGVAVLVAAALLWVFGQFDGAGPASMAGQTAVLGFPAALGAAVGRLLLGHRDD